MVEKNDEDQQTPDRVVETILESNEENISQNDRNSSSFKITKSNKDNNQSI